ncbi:hypothetical protein LSG31_18455 [Fodinisporobacter ferrooxydans]|uniref:Uncharacterized protein n=1 Tax=Fodinisporobacter ferrooxydans TaxID=2901836 RepID=A0ABY4CH42_9BACL|nr:hypothetical protein LSG31_18455 [Alicyclobacillaceae bacterium MYW30-H2]
MDSNEGKQANQQSDDKGDTGGMLQRTDEPVDWSRRKFLIGTGAMAIVGITALFGQSLIGKTIKAMTGVPVSKGIQDLYVGDYYYLPNEMVWRVGDEVVVNFHNLSPNRFHEWMMGQGFDLTPSDFGDVKTQFHKDFWDGVQVEVLEGHGVDNFVTNKAIIKSNEKYPWLITQQGQGNFSPTLMPGGSIRLKIKVPDKPGVWQYGCFVQGFVHYRAGMKGTLRIIKS